MTDRALLVPMSIETLVVPSGPAKTVSLAPRFEGFARSKLGAALRPEPWEPGRATDLAEGVHLHWRLPSALTHGLQAENGRVEFPRVPNRWLVLRVGAAQAQTRTWVVRSDDLQERAGTNAVLTLADARPAAAGETTPPKYVVKNIGMAYRYDEPWDTEPPATDVELTAVSAGNPIFAAFYPGCRNVFGLHDDLDGIDGGTFLYVVSGWYSRREDDPLCPEYTRAGLAEHVKEQWGLARFLPGPDGAPPTTPGPVPARTVCHGTVYGVRWTRKGASASAGAPLYRVAVGNTAVEALSALVAAPAERGRVWEPLLSAFQYGALGDRDQTRGMPEIDAELHRRRFHPVDGGTQWTIQRVERGEVGAEERSGRSFPADPEIAALYGALDDAQREADRLAREVAALREEAYAAWVRSARRGEPNVAALQALYVDLVTRIVGAAQKGVEAQQDVHRLCGALQAKGLRIPRGAGDGAPPARPEFELVASPMPSFFRANDPAILVAAPGVSRTHRYDATRPAAYRVVEEVVSAPNLGARTLPVTSKDDGVMPFDEIVALFRESLLFDPARPADEIRPVGARPDGALTSWEPTRDPLFMVWEVAWAPAYTDVAPADLIRQWAWQDNTDYRWAGAARDPEDEARRYLGWAPLSLDVSRQIQDRLRDAPKVAGLFAAWSMLTQTIGGLHDALITRDHSLQLPPLRNDGTVDAEVAGVVGTELPWSPLGPDRRGHDGFFPIRAGRMGITQLWLVDSFGQVQKVIDSDQQPVPVIAAESLRSGTEPLERWVALPPRIAQPARLLFRWRSLDGRESNANPSTSPIAGWIIPDHLDKGLLVCDARGRVRGEVRVTTAGASWSAAPGFAEHWDPVASLAGADVADLRRFVDGLVSAGSRALEDLLELIEGVSMSITSGGSSRAQGLGVFTGQPLALARASLALEVWGRPATDQRTVTPSTGGIGSVRFPVRLGDLRMSIDGLVGYFAGDDRRLRPAFAAPGPAAADLELSLDGGRVDVTLLLDPRAGIHLGSAIFPAQVLELPGYVTDALEDLESRVRVGPVLGDPEAFRIPVPDDGGSWTWVDVDRARDGSWAESADVGKPETGAAIPARPPRVREGWLSFKPVDRQPR